MVTQTASLVPVPTAASVRPRELRFAGLRHREHARFDAAGHAYLDYTGTALYAQSQVVALSAFLPEVMEAVAGRTVELVDVRSPQEFSGATLALPGPTALAPAFPGSSPGSAPPIPQAGEGAGG